MYSPRNINTGFIWATSHNPLRIQKGSCGMPTALRSDKADKTAKEYLCIWATSHSPLRIQQDSCGMPNALR